MRELKISNIGLAVSFVALITSGVSCGLNDDMKSVEATAAQGKITQEVLDNNPPPCGPGNDGEIWFDEWDQNYYQCSFNPSTGRWGWHLYLLPCFTGSEGGDAQLCPTPSFPDCLPPNGYPGTRAYINIFTTAIGRLGSDNACPQVGQSYTATNPQYVWCRRWGGLVSDGVNYNHWWLWTDLDTGGSGWISAYYISNQGDDHADGVPDCW